MSNAPLLPGFTVLGLYLDAGETEVLYVPKASTWYDAVHTVLAEAPRGFKLQIAGVCAGRVDLVGRWENLPFKTPAWSPHALGVKDRFTVFGFDRESDEGRADAAEAVGWVELAHAALNQYDPHYAFLGVARGVHPFVGTWPQYRDAMIEEELLPVNGAAHQVIAR